jgi:hypothetical protein
MNSCPIFFLEAHAGEGGLHPGNSIVVEVERRGLEVDVELARLGARGALVSNSGSSDGGTCDGGNARQRFGHHLRHRCGDVDHDSGFVRFERFERCQLGVEQCGRHEVAGTAFSA